LRGLRLRKRRKRSTGDRLWLRSRRKNPGKCKKKIPIVGGVYRNRKPLPGSARELKKLPAGQKKSQGPSWRPCLRGGQGKKKRAWPGAECFGTIGGKP